jgi:hypothetical protein
MNEIFPVMAGAAIGLLVPRFRTPWQRACALSLLSIACGAFASWISGELEISWAYVAIDLAQAAVAGLLVWNLVVRWRRRTSRERDSIGSMFRK